MRVVFLGLSVSGVVLGLNFDFETPSIRSLTCLCEEWEAEQ